MTAGDKPETTRVPWKHQGEFQFKGQFQFRFAAASNQHLTAPRVDLEPAKLVFKDSEHRPDSETVPAIDRFRESEER